MYKIRETIAKSLISTSLILLRNLLKCENVKKVVPLQCGKPKSLMRTQFCLKDFVSLSYTLRHSRWLGLSLQHLRIQFSSVAQSCLTLCNPMNHSTPGLPVHHHLLEFTQTHVHRVSDAIQPSHPLLSPSPPAPNPSQHQSIFQ